MFVNLLRTTYHPVVKTYMDVIQKGINNAGIQCVDVLPNNKIKKSDFLLTDSPLVAIKYILKGFNKHIVWFQGVSPEESFMSNKSHIRSKIISCIEKIVLKKAKVVFLVSKAMKEHYEKKYKIDLSHKSFIMPCFNETRLVDDSFEDSKYKENSFVYVGSLLAWQCFEETVELYTEIEQRSKKNTKFYVFTHQKEEAKRILSKHRVRNYEVDCVEKEELSNRIKEMKYGFVIRQNSVVNNVATPTKFSNYLANGIIPIYSSSLKSFADFDKNNSFGLVYDLDNINTGVEKILEHMERNLKAKEIKVKCQNAFETYYNADTYVKEISAKINEIVK